MDFKTIHELAQTKQTDISREEAKLERQKEIQQQKKKPKRRREASEATAHSRTPREAAKSSFNFLSQATFPPREDIYSLPMRMCLSHGGPNEPPGFRRESSFLNFSYRALRCSHYHGMRRRRVVELSFLAFSWFSPPETVSGSLVTHISWPVRRLGVLLLPTG